MIRTLVSMIVMMSAGLPGQSVPADKKFEVASVKPHVGPLTRIAISTSGPRLNAEGENVWGLIMYAYNLKNYQISRTGAPLAAVGDTFFDVLAKAEGDVVPSQADFRQMLQALLADRFQLAVHRERREMPVYELIVGKTGSKLKTSAANAEAFWHLSVMGRNYSITMPKATMADFIGVLDDSGFLPRPVQDKTGLTGTYAIKLLYTPDLRSREADPDLNDINIFMAVQEQLGLKLESQKGIVEILVVDHVGKPSGN